MEDYIAKPVTKRGRSRSAPCLLNERKNLIEDHYRVDAKAKEVLPGLPIHGNDWKRDFHDFFNLIILVSRRGEITYVAMMSRRHDSNTSLIPF